MSDDVTDIDAAQDTDPEALRGALLDQLRHLVEEVEALRTVVDGLPDTIKSGRPGPEVLTMKELYGALTTLDDEVRPRRVTRIVEEDTPTLDPVDIDATAREAGWNDTPLPDILTRLQGARRALVDQLEALPLADWHRTGTLDGESVTLFTLVHRMTQADTERLRDLGYRLHGAHLSDRDEPLPT
ncbi:MAG: DinB family protein [Salinivenus sp.]